MCERSCVTYSSALSNKWQLLNRGNLRCRCQTNRFLPPSVRWTTVPCQPLIIRTYPSRRFRSLFINFSMNSSRTNGAAPPPPPRNAQSFAREQQQPGLFPSNNYLSPYSASPFYGQQTAGYYNNYRYSPYGAPMNPPVGNFAQLAMDESRSAFSSIESVVNTFRSISIMLESTFSSVYSSFRAVTDVFDHFSRIRTEITAIYPLVLLWRFLKYLYHRLLRLLHLRRAQSGSTEETWSAIYNTLQQTTTNANGAPASSSSSLLVALFFIVSFGTPMLMLKFLNSVIRKKQGKAGVVFTGHFDRHCWFKSSSGESLVGTRHESSTSGGIVRLCCSQCRWIVFYTWYNDLFGSCRSVSFERTLLNDHMFLLAFQSTSSHWFMGTIDRIHTGLIPANYVQPVRTEVPSSITLRPQTPFNATVNRREENFSFSLSFIHSLLSRLVSFSFTPTATTAATTASSSSSPFKHSFIETSRWRTTYSIIIATFSCFGSFLCVSRAWLYGFK